MTLLGIILLVLCLLFLGYIIMRDGPTKKTDQQPKGKTDGNQAS
jgi:uncharacterized alpha/beta hydrolase family protein